MTVKLKSNLYVRPVNIFLVFFFFFFFYTIYILISSSIQIDHEVSLQLWHKLWQ